MSNVKLEVNEKVLTYIDYCKRMLLDLPVVASTLRLQEYQDILLKAMVYDLRAKVLAEELLFDTKTFRFSFTSTFHIPANWWEYLKGTVCYKNHCPHWLRRFLHHRTKAITKHYHSERTVNFTKYATYPRATISLPELGPPVYKYRLTARDGFITDKGL